MPRVFLCLLVLAACGGESRPTTMSTAKDEPQLPTDCATARSALKTFVDAHAVCAQASDCVALDGLGESAYCEDAVAPGADATFFRSLEERYASLMCSDVICGGTGPVDCIHERCVRTIPGDKCDACPLDTAPVCTTGGRTARNACEAAECLGEQVAHVGRCADGPGCLGAGGTCHLRDTGYYCPDGSRFDPGDITRDCPGSYSDNTCCVPDWGEPCTYLGVLSATLSVNPFTCMVESVPVCVQDTPTPGSCERSVLVGLSTGGGGIERLDSATHLSIGKGATVKLSGSASGDRSFTCTGTWSADTLTGNPLSCTTCVGTACSTCAVTQSDGCRLP